MSAVDLEVTIRPAGSAYRVEARCTAPDADAVTEASAVVQIDRLRLDALTLDSATYGRALGEMVLAGPIGGILGTARAIAERDEVPLRLRLDLAPDAGDLHTLRWETLRDPARPDQPLLTTGAQVVFSRYLSSSAWQPVGVPPLEELRALAVLSSPLDLADSDLSPLDLETERALVTASFGEIPVTVLSRGEANLDTITQHLGDGYDIIYLLAHGRAGEHGETWVFLEDADGLTAPTLGSEVATQIAELERRPRLIILGSCETAGDLARLGPVLAQVGVPAVVGMQGKVTIATLRRFLPECLRLLQQDGRIDLAVAQARGFVRGRPDFWMPVLFLRLLSGRLWEMAGTTPERPLTPEELLASLPLDRVPEPQNLPSPHWMPLRPNPLFVGREEELRELARLLKVGGTVAITTGIGGMGKTQLVVELAHRYGAYFAGGVFWVSCGNPANIPGEVAACGQIMELFPSSGIDQEAQVRLTRAAWAEPIPRLLIFDTCEEEPTLRQWLPATGGARVLVTSRRANWSVTLKVQPVPLEVLGRPASVALLQRLAPRLSSEEAEQIAEELGDLPLALHLAGCYLMRYPIPVADYLARLASAQLQHPSLQGRGMTDMPTEREPHVKKAFALSFERLDPNDPIDDLARQLLARAACFAPGEPFQRNWLEATITPEGDEEERQLVRTDAVERLLGLGLLERVDEGEVRLHRLLAAYAALALSDADALPAVERVVSQVAYLANETRVPQEMLLVLPHLRHLVQQAQDREDERVAMLCTHLSDYLQMVGSYKEALLLMRRALEIRERVLGDEHQDTAESLNDLGWLHYVQGEYGHAQPLMKQALEIRERVLGGEHQDTAESLNDLGWLHYVQGEYGHALPLMERALEIRERVRGKAHPETAESLNNLAHLHRVQRKYERAQPLMKRALDIRERELGPEHPDTAQSLNNLALLYGAQEAYELALPLFQRALAIREKILGAEHPSTATSLNNLADLYRAQEEYAQALPLMQRALAIRERMLGPEHPQTVMSLNGVAWLLCAQGAYREALPLSQRALAIHQRILGPNHPNSCACRADLRNCLANAQLGPLSPADTQDARIAQVLTQARAATDAALADPAVDRRALATAIEARARWAESGDEAWKQCAQALRALIVQLGVTPDDPDAL